jgi:hypothetical protein
MIVSSIGASSVGGNESSRIVMGVLCVCNE